MKFHQVTREEFYDVHRLIVSTEDEINKIFFSDGRASLPGAELNWFSTHPKLYSLIQFSNELKYWANSIKLETVRCSLVNHLKKCHKKWPDVLNEDGTVK